MKREPRDPPRSYPEALRRKSDEDLAAVRREGHPGCRASWYAGHQRGFSEGLRTGLRLSDEGKGPA